MWSRGGQDTWIDVIIRALVQENLLPLDKLTQQAVREKRRNFPVKNDEGRHVVNGNFVPFIMNNMVSLDNAGHQFLRRLRKKNPRRTEHPMDVLMVQHAKWIARRLQRSHGHYNKSAGSSDLLQRENSSPCPNCLRVVNSRNCVKVSRSRPLVLRALRRMRRKAVGPKVLARTMPVVE